MKIFYGVQGTGNGHITRARVMARELYAAGYDVTFLFTGRPKDQLFDMEIFNGFDCLNGLSFHVDKGQVSYFKTMMEARPIQVIREVKNLDLEGYDLIISDFEPITSWAAKKQKRQVLGIGHQYAFEYDIPVAGSDPLARQVMKYFAPADIGVGLHWHHFDQPILPPIIDIQSLPDHVEKNKIIVYLPFEEQNSIVKMLSSFRDFEFHVYSSTDLISEHDHIIVHPLSREGFKRDFLDCSGIISNAGFELASEAFQMGKKLLVKPLASQMEQISNALAVQQLEYGQTTDHLQASGIEEWLSIDQAVRISYPNVAREIVKQIGKGVHDLDPDWFQSIWANVETQTVTL